MLTEQEYNQIVQKCGELSAVGQLRKYLNDRRYCTIDRTFSLSYSLTG